MKTTNTSRNADLLRQMDNFRARLDAAISVATGRQFFRLQAQMDDLNRAYAMAAAG
jgi:hypothetical protein